MQNIKITLIVEGLDGLVQAIDNLAGAIQAQEALVVPVDTETAAVKEPKPEKPAKLSKAKETGVSPEQVREKFVELARAGKRDELKALLADYDVENVSALEEDVLEEVAERLEAM